MRQKWFGDAPVTMAILSARDPFPIPGLMVWNWITGPTWGEETNKQLDLSKMETILYVTKVANSGKEWQQLTWVKPHFNTGLASKFHLLPTSFHNLCIWKHSCVHNASIWSAYSLWNQFGLPCCTNTIVAYLFSYICLCNLMGDEDTQIHTSTVLSYPWTSRDPSSP